MRKKIIIKYIRNIAFLFLIVFASAQKSKAEKVLFVGNSFTFYFNLPLIVESMAYEKGVDLDVYQSTAGGATLKDHWTGKKNLKTVDRIKKGGFDTIVLQDYSTNPLIKTKESIEYFNKFIDLSHSLNAKVLIYSTWTYPAMKPEQYQDKDPINLVLKSLVEDGVSLVPVGKAFRLFQDKYPNVEIFTSDNKHPSPVGVYLAACFFMNILTKKSPKGLYRRFDRKDERGKKIFLAMVEKSDAIKCQDLITEIVENKETPERD